jgi:hypothetical protein
MAELSENGDVALLKGLTDFFKALSELAEKKETNVLVGAEEDVRPSVG